MLASFVRYNIKITNGAFVLKIRQRISESKATKMIYAFVHHGDHSNRSHTDTLNNGQIKLWFKQNGFPFKELVSKTREWDKIVPFVENQIHSTFHVVADGVGVESSIINNVTGETIASMSGKGLLVDSDYQAKFESAARHKAQAIQLCDLEELYSAIVKGIAAIESYFIFKANNYNSIYGHEKLIDSKDSPVSLEDKFRKWVPVLSGRKFDFSKNSWAIFKELLEIRHNEAIHPKNIASAITYEEIAETINKFRDGLATVFFDLHQVLGDDIKRILIRESYYPDVYVEK